MTHYQKSMMKAALVMMGMAFLALWMFCGAAYAWDGACCYPDESLPDPPHYGYDCVGRVLETVCYEEHDGVAWLEDTTCREMVAIVPSVCPPEDVPTMPLAGTALLLTILMGGSLWIWRR